MEIPTVVSSQIEGSLMKFLKRTIDNGQEAILVTDEDIALILLEFQINLLSGLHELEKDIYIELIKKSLADYPLWKKIGKNVQNRADNKFLELEIQSSHSKLKEHLANTLKTAKPLIKKAVDEIKTEYADSASVEMEVICSRTQLNKLFYRQPRPTLNNTILNVESISFQNMLYSHTLKSIFNWPNVSVLINLGSIVFKRNTHTNVQRTLVNKPRKSQKIASYNVGLQAKMNGVNPKYTLNDFFKVFPPDGCPISQVLSGIIEADLTCERSVHIPSDFRRTLNKYPYVRYLYSEVDSKDVPLNNPYDLQLVEVMVPKMQLSITKFSESPMLYSNQWMEVKCLECNVSYQNWSFKGHFQEFHTEEHNWECMNCRKSFDIIALAESSWRHDCDSKNS